MVKTSLTTTSSRIHISDSVKQMNQQFTEQVSPTKEHTQLYTVFFEIGDGIHIIVLDWIYGNRN